MEPWFAVPDVWLLLTLCLLIAVSSVLQTATGFGFAILSAPIGAALLGGPQAVTMVLVTGTAVDLLILGLRRRRPDPRWDEVAVVGLASLPGLALGAYLLVVLPRRGLMVVIAVAVVAAVALRWLARRRGGARVVGRRWGAVAGLASGTLATSTTLGGPPTVFYLGHRPYPPAEVRDTLVTLNLVRLPLSVAVLAAGGALVVVPGLGWLVIASLAGYAVGHRVFGRLDASRYEVLVSAVLLGAAATALVVALLG